MPYSIVDQNGWIVEVLTKPSIYTKLRAGQRMLGYNPPEVDSTLQVATPVVPVPADATEVQFTVAWVPGALELARAEKNSRINAARAAANQSTFTFAGKEIAVDALSRSDIDGAHGAWLLTGGPPPGWPGGWKATDNTIVPITDMATWAAFYGAMVAAGTANFNRAQTLKAQLALATTVEEVRAVPDW